MYLADYHMHSRFSPDASYSMTQMAQAAIEAGLQEICFTDHVEPITWSGGTLRGPYNWKPLAEDFRAAQAAVGDRLTLRLGIELGDAPSSFSHTKRLLADVPELDFIIGSIHVLSPAFGSEDLFLFEPKNEAEAYAGIEDYLDRVETLAQWGQFSVLGHLTLPLRYLNENRGHHFSFDGYEDRMERIFRALIANNCGIELNTNRGNTPLPDKKWLQMYRELGGEIITLGTDAHSPRHVGCAVRERQKLLKDCGFTVFHTFSRMQPIAHAL